MPRVDFYVLEGDDRRARLVFACRLAEKAFNLEQRVALVADAEPDAVALDDLLWTFRDRSFVPHALQEADGGTDTPVVIAWRGRPATGCDLAINLGAAVPEGFGGFGRIAEIVDGDAARRRAGRERYRYYLEQGIKPETHTIGAGPGGEQETP
jgi:DNA polymerase-3 subunit chi